MDERKESYVRSWREFYCGAIPYAGPEKKKNGSDLLQRFPIKKKRKNKIKRARRERKRERDRNG